VREEHRLFENRMLRRIFCPKRDKATEERRRIHNKEFYDLNSSLNIIQVTKSRRMSLAAHVACMGRGEVHTGFWWGCTMEKRPLGKPRCRWDNDIKTDLQEVGLFWVRLGTGNRSL